MKTLGSTLDFWHGKLGGSQTAVGFAIKLRNQCNAVIRHRLTDGIHPERNGEYLLLDYMEKSRMVFVDAGANVGDWTAKLLATKREVCLGLLFEPSRSAVEILKKRFRDLTHIEVVPCGLSDTAGSRRFFEEPNAGTMSSFVGSFGSHGAEITSANLTTLDAEASKRGIEQIDFLKIDAEGLDLSVLRGAESLLKSQRISVIQFEYNQAWAREGHTLAAAYEFLCERGYCTYLLKAAGLYELRYDTYGEYFGYSNFVSFPRVRKVDFERLTKGSI